MTVGDLIDGLGGIDILVNVVACPTRDEVLLEGQTATWERVVEDEVVDLIETTQGVVPHMRQQKAGRIINIVPSLPARQSTHVVTSATTRAVIGGITQALAKELMGHGITVNAVVCSIAIQHGTSTERGDDLPGRNRGAAPKDAAVIAAFLASAAAGYITGEMWLVDGGQRLLEGP